jgi:hypothetical protein
MSISDLTGPRRVRMPAAMVDVQAMRFMELQAGTGPNYETVAYLPLHWERLPVDAGIPRVWWFTLKVPPGTPPGYYTGKVTFEAENAPSAEMGVRFWVYPFELAPLRNHFQALYHDYYQFPGGGMDRSMLWQRDVGFNVVTTSGNISGLSYHSGSIGRPDFSDWARRLEVYRHNGFPLQLVISQGALAAAYTATGELRADAGFEGAHQVKEHFSAEFEDCYKQLARAIRDEFGRRGWPEIIFYEGGEAACEGPRGVRTETHLMRLLQAAGVENTTSVSGQATPLSLRYSAPHMHLAMLSEVNPENIARVQQAGSRFGIYGPGETRFERGFWFWRTGAMLCSEEGGVALYGNPYDPFDGSRAYDWGDVYPAPDGPAISLHTAEKRAGIDDSRYLYQLQALTAEANRQATPALLDAAVHARKVLLEIMWSLNLDIAYYETQGEELPGPILDQLREKVALEIVKMRHAFGL